MKVLSRPFLVATLAFSLLGFASAPTNAAHRGGGLPTTALGVWRSTLCAGTAVLFV